jgi:hypothetical protein
MVMAMLNRQRDLSTFQLYSIVGPQCAEYSFEIGKRAHSAGPLLPNVQERYGPSRAWLLILLRASSSTYLLRHRPLPRRLLTPIPELNIAMILGIMSSVEQDKVLITVTGLSSIHPHL